MATSQATQLSGSHILNGIADVRQHAQRPVVVRAYGDHIDPNIHVPLTLGQVAARQTPQLPLLARIDRLEQLNPIARVAAAAHFHNHRNAVGIARDDVGLAPGARVVALEDAVAARAQPLRGQFLPRAAQVQFAPVNRPRRATRS